MKKIYDTLSGKVSRIITTTYSTSFSLGIKMLNHRLHQPIYNIYGFVRVADEIVDSFHGFDKKLLMNKLRSDTAEAIRHKVSVNPVLNSFQETVHAYGIEWDLIDAFLQSMEMDLEERKYDQDLYSRYIYGSAEVVGLMCLQVFTEGDRQLYDQLKPYARRLGAAFQKINFLRDINADFNTLGRTYFPGINFENFTRNDKILIEKDIQKDFDHALFGIRKLPAGAGRGVYLAYFYYLELFKKIQKTPHTRVATARIRISDLRKALLMAESLLRYKLNML